MYGMIARLTAAAGQRSRVIRILGDATASMPGCLGYVIAEDAADPDVIWVTEVWDSQAAHDASLSLPQVLQAIAEVRPLIPQFERIAVTSPVRGVQA